MTNLEYIICEAEAHREISIDTRNKLLLALYEKEESDNQSNSELIDVYTNKKKVNSIIGRILAESNSSDERSQKIHEEINKFDRLISYASNQKESAPDKVPFKDVLKASHKAGLKSAGAAIGINTVGNKLGASSGVKTAAIAGTSAAIANNSSKDIPRTKSQWDGIIKSLTQNKKFMIDKFHIIDEKLKKKGK